MANPYAAYGINAIFGIGAICEGLIWAFEAYDAEAAIDSFGAAFLYAIPAIAGYTLDAEGKATAPNTAAGTLSGIEALGFMEYLQKPSRSVTYNIAPAVLGISAVANIADFGIRECGKKKV